MKEKQCYGRGVPKGSLLRLCLTCNLFIAPLLISSAVCANTDVKITTSTALPQTQNMRTLKGTVKDEQGGSFPGATIQVKGTTLGVVTDIDGNFSITIPSDPNTVLVISFVGMKTQEIKVGTAPTLNVILKEDSQTLEQVVVNGVFERKANTFTGSVKTISNDELKRVGNSNVLQSLKNLDPSILFIDNMALGSDPNAVPEMVLRGKSSINMEETDLKATYGNDPNAPLFVLDGFEVSIQKIMDLDMDRVESMTILKDASAKAIYGSKAANGVIVIELKKNPSGDLRVTYQGSVEIEAPDLSSYDLCNAAEKLEIEKEFGMYDDEDANYDNQRMAQKIYNQKLSAVVSGINTDWLSKPVRLGVGTKHGVSVELGDRELRAIIDLSYNNIKGVMKGSDRTTISGGISLSYRREKFLFRNQTTVTSNVAQDSPYGSFEEYAKLNPYYTPYDQYGQISENIVPHLETGNSVMVNNWYKEIEFQANPLYNAQLNTLLQKKYIDLTNNFEIQWFAFTGMKITGRLGLSETRNREDTFYPANHLKFRDFKDDDQYRKGSYQLINGESSNLDGKVDVQYNKEFLPGHTIYANAGFNLGEKKMITNEHNAEGFPSDKMNDIIFARQYAKDAIPTGRESTIRDMGILFAANYAFDDRFLVDGSYRTSASSQYGKNNRWGSFWSVGLGWNIHNEAWLKDSKIQQLKLRGSLGYTGSQSADAYESLATYEYDLQRVYGGFLGAMLKGMRNDDLKWQEKFDYNIGVDFNLGRVLGVKFDYYIGKTKNNLLDFDIPTYTGFETVKENIGDVENKGFDIRLSVTPWNMPKERGYFTITTAISRNKNRVTGVSSAMKNFNAKQNEVVSDVLNNNKPVQKYYDGVSLDAIWAVRSLGIDPSNGQEIYLDKNGNRTYTYRVADQVVCGDEMPDFQGTAGFMFSYKGIELNATFRFQYGAQMYNQTLVDKVENASLTGNVDKRLYAGRWRNPGDIKPYKTLPNRWVEEEREYKDEKTQPTSRFVQDRNEFSLSSLRIGYDFWKYDFIKKLSMERLRVEFYMNDVFMLSSIKTERGTSYPFARSFNFAIQATF